MMPEKLRILILEDAPSDAELVQRELRKAKSSFVTKCVGTREAFLAALESFSPDLILSDYTLPDIDGTTALRLVSERAPEVPVIIVTGSISEEAAVECMKAGAADYVIKDHLARLVPAVQGALERKRERERRLAAERASEQAEAELRKSEKQFRELLESAADGIVIVDDRQQIVFVNAQAEQLFGYTRQELIGQPVHMLVPGRFGDHSKHVESYLAEPTRRPMAQSQELYGQRKDGSEVPIDVSLSSLETDEGLLVTAVVHDVTEHRQATEALRRSEQQYRDLVEHAAYGIYRASPEGRFLAVNPALVAMIGYESEAEVIALDLARDIYADPALQEHFVEKYSGAVPIEGLEVEWKRKDGKLIVVRLSGKPISDGEGHLQYFEMIVEDATERRSLEAQLRQAQKLEAVGRLAGGVAHDFNNLLTVVLGESEMTLADLPPQHPARDGLQEIHNAGERATALTRQLLAFSRKQVVETVVFNLNELVADLEKMLRRLIGEDIELISRTAADAGAVRADQGQIEQVLMNLAVNAREAMPQGGQLVIEAANVTLDEDYARSHADVTAGDYVQISVSDSGTGMTDDVKAQLFEPFFTTKERGTGLGLAVCYGIVKQFGGHIGVYSEQGVGTTMKVYLPRIAEAVEPTRKRGPAALPNGTETILLVEDDEAVRRRGVRILRARGYRVLEAPDGAEALRVLDRAEGPVQLLLTDVVLPKMAGRILADRVRELRPDVKVLFVSGYTDDVILQQQLLERDVTLLQKPFTSSALACKVREVLDQDEEGLKGKTNG